MERVYFKAKNFKEAEEWDIVQYIQMTSEQRQVIAKALKIKVYGNHPPDLREAYKKP